MAARPPSSLSFSLACRRLAAALAFVPMLAFGQPSVDAELAATREMVRFVPGEALRRLGGIEAAARRAPVATRAEFLFLYSDAFRRAGDPRQALALADELVGHGRSQGNDTVLAKGELARSYALTALNDLPGAHVAAFESERRAAGIADIALRVQTIITAGQAFQEQGNYPAALPKFQAAVDLARTIEDDQVPLSMALNGLVLLLTDMRQYDKGWEVQAESMALAKRMRSRGRQAIALLSEYGLAMDSAQYDRARAALLETLKVVRQLGARQMEAATLANLADSYLKDREYPRAADYAQQAVAAATAVNETKYLAVARINLGQAYLNMGRVAEGRQQFEAGLALYEKGRNLPQLQVVLAEYGNALERAGDYRNAISAYHRERAISNELFAAQRQKAMLELQHKYDTEKKQRQIEALRQENRVKGAELDNRRLQQRIWWLLAVVFALAAVIVGLLYRKVRQANAQLEVKNLELKQQSTLDPLTSLYNRRHFQDFMRTHALAERRQQAAAGDELVGALFLLDVDHFKHINDSHGHAAGDAVLKTIAAGLRDTLRETDMIVRWGGEEFLAFLPAVPRCGLDEVARRILRGVSSQAIAYGDKTLRVNVSVGFAPYPLAPGGTPLSWERAVNLVDMALYMAKSHGRNRAYGIHGFNGLERTTLEAIEQDLEGAWRNGFVDMAVVQDEAAAAEAQSAPVAELPGMAA
ncbi:GGDEF domain-containing protein [Pseudoduganella umbonata]|uniref:diguanylate cyclase n=1 Tax=Pseudoduganella umbonata TaxID=864828 RepID=A0A7W5E947_9BURK|nr:GGDEF domain-containing protein [Pseudoduganella umbonata]MBB3220969.1 diguanylate cyclase (GGDEF)-like protein [Pseudoduganella umbonata]